MSCDRRRALQYAAAVAVAPLLPACRPAAPDKAAPGYFAGGALRLDLRHTARGAAEGFELTATRREAHWPRGLDRLAEAPDWGDYRISLHDADGTVVFREGFDSMIDAGGGAAVAQLSVRVPLPLRALRASVGKRRPGSTFTEVTSFTLDPGTASLDAATARPATRVETIIAAGDERGKVDLAILGDGYREDEHVKFVADAKRAAGYLFSVEPFARRATRFNVRAVFAASEESGVTDAYLGVRRKTAFAASYGQGLAERTLSVGDERALREAASAVPYDFLLVLANARRYGGSARFGGPAVVSIDNAAARYLVLHELGHVIGGLAEEYYIPADGGPVYRGNVEPWQSNVTISAAGDKWGSGLSPQAWNQPEYDRHFARYVKRYYALRARGAAEAEVERLMHDAAAQQSALLAPNGRRAGLYEGANGYAKGVYRAEADCIMFSLQTRYFCTACEAALERMIGSLTI